MQQNYNKKNNKKREKAEKEKNKKIKENQKHSQRLQLILPECEMIKVKNNGIR